MTKFNANQPKLAIIMCGCKLVKKLTKCHGNTLNLSIKNIEKSCRGYFLMHTVIVSRFASHRKTFFLIYL